MTATLPERPDVDVATDQDLRVAIDHALDRAGISFDELTRQAQTGHFESVRARLAWVAVGDLERLADGHRGELRPGEAG
jgi:hypothetical protein